MIGFNRHGVAKTGGWRRLPLCALLLALSATAPAWGKDVGLLDDGIDAARAPEKIRADIALDVSQAKMVVLPTPAKDLFIADPAIANVQVAHGDHVFIYGKKAGHTDLYVLGENGKLLRSLAIEVDNPTGRAQKLTAATPGSGDIRVGNTANGLVIEGSASDAAAAALAQRSTAENAPEKAVIDDRVKVRGSVQVTLRVRIAEVSRTITKQLGINWNALMKAGNFTYGLYTGRTFFDAASNTFNPAAPLQAAAQPGSIIGGFNTAGGGIDGVIDALAEEGLVTVLAEPTLTAISGQTASFLAGGEFPVPVSQALGVTTIDFKSYGVSLNFIPTVMAANHISLRVKPEVSQITSQGAITVGGLQIPALSVRRADTTIELGSGQSFAIAGLLQNNSTNDIQRFPGLGDLPVLGALFRSTSFQHNESELLIIVTPFIVRPIDDPKAIRLPTDVWQAATDVERILKGYVASPHPDGKIGALPQPSAGPGVASPHLLGTAGFDIE